MARQMNYYDNRNPRLVNINDQYFCGRDILIAAVTDTNVREKEVVLPEGKWVDSRTGKRYCGDTTISVSAPLDDIPIFIQSGSLIPMAPRC